VRQPSWKKLLPQVIPEKDCAPVIVEEEAEENEAQWQAVGTAREEATAWPWAARPLISGRPILVSVEKIALAVESLTTRLVGAERLNPFYHTDTIAVYLLVIVAVTGLYLTLFYVAPGLGTRYAYGAVLAIDSRPDGQIVIGYNASGTGYTSGTTELENSGSVNAFPVIVLSYSSAATDTAPLYSISNLTTQQTLAFSLGLVPGEIVTIDLRHGIKRISGNVRGDLTGTLVPGSPLTTFKLAPGLNVLNIFVDIAAAANVTAYAYWVPNYSSLEDATH